MFRVYLEWAPVAVFTTPTAPKPEPQTKDASAENNDSAKKKEEEEEEEQILPGSTLFIKNLNFNTSEETLRETFSKCAVVKSCTVSKKRDKAGQVWRSPKGKSKLPGNRRPRRSWCETSPSRPRSKNCENSSVRLEN